MPRRLFSLFLFGFFFCVPRFVSAFQVSPSVVDLSFSDASVVTQVVSLVNIEESTRVYDARVQRVVFAPDGSISRFEPVPVEVGMSVSPQNATVAPDQEEFFTITFAHPDEVLASHVFSLVLSERLEDNGELSGGFVVLLFPESVAQPGEVAFRIDTFSVQQENFLHVVAQFSNTGSAVVKPTSLLVAKDFLGRERYRGFFGEHEGRLPVGSTRVLEEELPFADFGMWHVGGPVTFILSSVGLQGGEVQRATVVLQTMPGTGVVMILFCGAICFLGAIFLLVKRRGILRV